MSATKPTPVNKLLSPGGAVAKNMSGYELRPQQLAMAEEVARAFDDGEHLLVEAGTGVGKSFAYLIPAIERAVRTGERVVISTHTIALQEQLIHKDIPFLKGVFPQEFSAVLVKGRSNYVGLRRLARASQRKEGLFDERGQVNELWRIEDWAYKTEDGSLADLDPQPALPVWERVKSEHDDCLGRRCATYKQCFYQRARRRAAEAQILVVNHALLFSDVAARRQGASILPDYNHVVLDEAHTVESVAGDHLGTNLSNTQVLFLLQSLHNPRTGKGLLHAAAQPDAVAAVVGAKLAAEAYFDAVVHWAESQRGFSGRVRQPLEVPQSLSATLVELRQQLHAIREATENIDDKLELLSMMDRCEALAGAVALWHTQGEPQSVYWIEHTSGRTRRVTLCCRPIDVGPVLRESLFDAVRSVVMTSATLTTGGAEPFAYIRSRLALENVRTLALGSPFNYAEQMTAYVAASLPDPSNGAQYIPAACEAIKRYLRMSEGQAFVLFTSYSMIQECANRLTPFLEAEGMPLLMQGSGLPRGKMLERFRCTPRCVLFGADTFWAGVDVAGEALRNVIIVKLPFAVPSQPMVEARIERIREQGGNPFMDFQVPEAVLKFRQGIGRLIRTRTDKGMVVVLDPRVISKPYGKLFLEALPDCRVVIESEAQP